MTAAIIYTPPLSPFGIFILSRLRNQTAFLFIHTIRTIVATMENTWIREIGIHAEANNQRYFTILFKTPF
jgi:hypothetical protein